MKIGYDSHAEYNFNISKEFITNYIRNLNIQIKQFDLDIKDKDLLTNPKEIITQTYIKKHISSLPSFMDEDSLLDNFNFDFGFIDKNAQKVSQIVNQYGISNGTLNKPDFNIYTENDSQIEIYIQLQKVVDSLNDLFDTNQNKFTIHLGQIANSFSGMIETNLSSLPHIQVNTHTLKTLYPN